MLLMPLRCDMLVLIKHIASTLLMASEEEREQLILQEMRIAGVDRGTAEFMVAQELGEIDGDVIPIEDDADND